MRDIKLDGFIKFVDEKFQNINAFSLKQDLKRLNLDYKEDLEQSLTYLFRYTLSKSQYYLHYPTNSEAFYKIITVLLSPYINVITLKDTIIQILSNKNHDYSSNDDIYGLFESTRIKTPTALEYEIEKQVNRLKNLVENSKTPQNESIKDNLLDLLGYRLLLDY